MARPQSVSDATILEAARHVIGRRGYEAFTLSEVAEEVGLSRAAIILRFQSTEALKLRLTRHFVDQFIIAIENLPVQRSGDGLIELARFIGQKLGDRGGVSTFFQMHSANMDNAELAALEVKRGEAWRNAISQRMPRTVLPHEDAVAAFAAHITGSILAWQTAAPPTDGEKFLTKRTRDWLTLAQIPFSLKRTPAPAA